MEESREAQRRARLRIAAILTSACLILCVGGAFLALWFVQLSEGAPAENFTVPSPQVVFLTNQPGATVTYSVTYYQGSYTEPGQTIYTGPDSDTPLNTRALTFVVHVSPRAGQLKFALLLNRDAAMTDASATRGVGYIDSTVPGGAIQSSCPSLYSFSTNQVLSGVTDVNSTGDADISLVGGIPSYVHYPNNGDLIPVNVLQMLPTGGGSSNSGASACSVNLINWEQVGGVSWETPAYGSGQVSIGSVPPGLYIESANPPTVDAQTLSWNLQGAADVSYTLFDSDSQSADAIWLFWAGVVAAFSATMLVEFIKSCGEMARTWSEKDGPADRPGAPAAIAIPPSAESARSSASKEVTRWPAFSAGLLSGIIIGRHRRQRNDEARQPPSPRAGGKLP